MRRMRDAAQNAAKDMNAVLWHAVRYGGSYLNNKNALGILCVCSWN